MKKLFLTAGILLMSTALLPTTVNAAEYTSNGAITFEADPNPTNPVDPTDPEKPVDPVDQPIPMDQTTEQLDHYRLILLQVFNLATN